jgi:hypothetical protein
MDKVNEIRKKAARTIDNRVIPSADEIARLVAKALRSEELHNIGSRSYVNAFEDPSTRFNRNEAPVVAFEHADPLIRPQPYSYMVFQDTEDAYYYAKNFKGSNEFSGNAAATIQNAENSIEAAGGGAIFFKEGTYTSSAELLIQ